MGQLKLELARQDGAPQYAGLYTLTPQALVLNARIGSVGFAWVWPIGVVATRAGVSQRIPIVDATRWVQFSLWFSVVVAGLVIWLDRRWKSGATARKKEK
ncbi:MAG: hypothetical protein IPK16_21345 [Anaerolineales bacterium]|nr:hypothetical protein [Anaerolineales bacterium]